MKLKRFLMASALALSFVVSAPSTAQADPISAAVVAFVGFTGTAATVATFVINSALYAAGSWAAGKAGQLLSRNKGGVAERQASVTALSLGETPREVIVGRACVGGTLVDAFNFGGKYGTDTVTRIIALCDHEVQGLVGYYVDDQYFPFTADGVQPGFNGKLSIEFKNARADGWDPPLHVRQNGGWTMQDRLVSVTHVVVDHRVDDQVWTQGHPRLRFVVEGLKAYDPRQDVRFGYTGPNPHVWEDPSTHTFTRNAELLRYALQRGVFATGRQGQIEHLLVGRGLTEDEAPPQSIIAAANICDEQVDGEARYSADGLIHAGQSFIEIEEMFAAAMAGVIVQREGGVQVEPGHAKAVVCTITDADLVVGERVTFSNFLPDNERGRINTVIPRYVEPSQGWKDHGGPPRRDLADIVADGGPRETTLPLMLVISGKQADRNAEIARRRARLERRASICLPPEFAEIEEGDWIAWQSDRYLAGATVRFQITNFGLNEQWRMRLSLEEIASSVFGQPDPIEDRADPPPPPVPVDALTLPGVTVEAITLAGETTAIPAIRFRWSIETLDTAMTAIQAEVRVVGGTEVAPTRTEMVNAGEMIVTNGVGPQMELQGRLVPIGDPSRPVAPSPWVTVSTSAVVADVPPEIVQKIEDILQDVEAIEASVGEVVEEVGEVRQFATDELASVNARLTVEELASRSEAAALATRASLLEASARTLPNLLPNSDFSQGKKHWGGDVLWQPHYDGNYGSMLMALGGAPGEHYLISDLVRVYASSTYTLSFVGDQGREGGVEVYCSSYDEAGAYIPGGDGLGMTNMNGATWFSPKKTTFITHPSAGFVRVVVRKIGFGGNNSYNSFISRLMLTAGSEAVRWSDQATARDLSARVQASEGAIATHDGRLQAWAQKRVIAGSAETFVEMNAVDNNGVVTADINMGARRLGLFNPVDGGWLNTLEVIGGEVRVARKLYVGSGAGQFSIDGPGQLLQIRDEASRLKLELGKLS